MAINLLVFIAGAISVSIVFVIAFAFAMRIAFFYNQKRDPINALVVRRKNFIEEKEKSKAVSEYLDRLA